MPSQTTKTALTEEFMFQNVAYRPTVYITGLHTDQSKEAYAENLVKIASELSVLEPIQQGDFFVPTLGQKLVRT